MPPGSSSFGDLFSNNGEDSTLMNSMSEFYYNEHNISFSAPNQTNLFCAMANLHGTLGFSYQFVDCGPGFAKKGKFILNCISF